MTSDQIQQAKTGRALLPRGMRGDAVAGLKDIKMAHPQDIMSLIARHEMEKDGWKRAMTAAMAILNKAYGVIEQTQNLLAERESRIRELEELASRDALTGLMNRGGFFEAFDREIGRVARKTSRGGVLILIDVDNFEAVQKIYGPEAAETSLRVLAQALKHEIRPMDVAARIGGDEFVVLLADTDKDRALERVQHLALHLNNLSFIWDGAEICMSASLGLKSYTGGDDAGDIFEAADQHLQHNKEERKTRASA